MSRKSRDTMEVVMRVLRITEQQYHTHLLEEGMRYLDLYMGSDEQGRAGRDELVRMPEYWSWWKRQWHQRTERFVKEQQLDTWGACAGKWERVLLHRLWNELHSADRLELRVARRVMNRATKRIIAGK